MAYDALCQLQASATKTANWNATAIDLGTGGTSYRGLEAQVLVTAASGTTPTLDLIIQESGDNSTWQDLVTFEQITTTGEYKRKFSSDCRYIRLSATVGGTTPSFTLESNIGLVP